MIATLPMYDLPWLGPANDKLWTWLASKLRARGISDVPPALLRDADLDAAWTAPSLLLGQTCGYPLLTRLGGRVRLVATPHYKAQGCEGPFHRAAILVRHNDPARSLADLQGRSAGINSYDSNTGMNLFRAAIADIFERAEEATEPAFFDSVVVTGSHARSFAALISGKIDVASIDAVTLALLGDRYPDHIRHLRLLEWTEASPSLPFITSLQTPDSVVLALQEELANAATDAVLKDALGALRIEEFSIQPLDAYERIVTLENQAAKRGYPKLH